MSAAITPAMEITAGDTATKPHGDLVVLRRGGLLTPDSSIGFRGDLEGKHMSVLSQNQPVRGNVLG